MQTLTFTDAEARHIARGAIGRLFQIASRPEAPGDDVEYAKIRSVLMEVSEGRVVPYREAHDYGRDRLKGAQGDY